MSLHCNVLNPGNSFEQHSDKQFSTIDADNDLDGVNCAVQLRGGWWYHNCHDSNLNGVYRRSNFKGAYADGITWYEWHDQWYSLKTTEMKISPVP